MADKEFPKDIHDKLSMYITNKKYIERLTLIPEHMARRDHMNIPQLIEKATIKNKQIRTELNNHLHFDALISDIESGKIKMKRPK